MVARELAALKERVRHETLQSAQRAATARRKMLHRATHILATLRELFADVDELSAHYDVASLATDCRRTLDRLLPEIKAESALCRRMRIRSGEIPEYTLGGDERREVVRLRDDDEMLICSIRLRNQLRQSVRADIEAAAAEAVRSVEQVFPAEWSIEEHEHGVVLAEIEELLEMQIENIRTHRCVAGAFSISSDSIPLSR